MRRKAPCLLRDFTRALVYHLRMFIQRFALTIWRASTDALSYVTDFGARRTGSGIGYLYAVTTTLAFFGLLPFAIGAAIFAPHIETFANDQLTIVQDWYPDELVLAFSGGTLTTNVDEPYILDLPAQWRTMDEGEPTHAVVIDTSATSEDFGRYGTAVLLTKTAAVVQDDNGLRVFPYDELEEDFTINEALVAEGVLGLSAYTPSLPWIAWGLCLALLLVLPWIVGGAVWAMNLFFLLWASLLLWVVSSIMGRNHRYGTLYRLGLFGVTSSLLLNFALTMTGIEVPFAAYVLFFGWMIYVISVFPKRAPVVPAPLPPAAVLTKSAPAKKASPTKAEVKKPRKTA